MKRQVKIVTGRGWDDFSFIEVEDPIEENVEVLGFVKDTFDKVLKTTSRYASGKSEVNYSYTVTGKKVSFGGGQKTREFGCTEHIANVLLGKEEPRVVGQ